MGCACKAVQQMDYLQKHYGVNIPKNKITNIRGKVKGLFSKVFLIPVMPIMFIGILFNRKGKSIKIDKLLKKVN